MTRYLAIAIAACALVVSSCSSGANNVVLSALNRSAKIQLLCADLEDLEGNRFILKDLLPSVICKSDTVFASDINAQRLGAVTQIQTGEVAVVNFTNSSIINTNPTIPGVTAVTVGEQPTGIQISPFDSTYAYVTSFSPKSLQAIESAELIVGESALEPGDRVVTRRFDAGPTDLALHEKATVTAQKNGEDQIISTSTSVAYRYLYAALPELGQIAQVEVMIDEATGAQSLGEPVFLTLDIYDCDGVTQVPPPPSDASDYKRMCPQSSPDPADPNIRVVKEVTTTEHCAEGASTGPRPVSLAVDYGIEQGNGSALDTGDDQDDVLLVADANQPVIHRFKVDENGATALDPIVTGTPTSEIDVTPLVPAGSDSNDRAATQRYLYAVSATDGSVLAVDYTEDPEGTPDEEKKFGAVLPVLAGVTARANEEGIESRDRIRFQFSNVRAIEVVSPSYDLVDVNADPDVLDLEVPESEICDSNDSNAFALADNADNMRGVFLAVSLSDGRMFFLDIYDLNAPCRGGAGDLACTTVETGPDRFASIRRHRLRFGITPTTPITIDGSPSFQFNATPGRLDELSGRPVSSDGPGLEFILCPPSMRDATNSFDVSSMFPVFGEPPSGGDADGLICASSQVWSSPSEGWEARWEGLIPNSEGGLGLFADAPLPPLDESESGNWFQAGDVPFCQTGVLGPQEPDADLVESYVGDRLLITGELPPSTRDEPRCELFLDLKDEIDDRPVWFPILRAFNNQLQIGPSPNDEDLLDLARSCFPQFTEYQIHTQGVYTVSGTQSGFIHRVVPGVDGECVPDATRPVDFPTEADPYVDVDTYLTGRAFEDRQFINPLVSFRITPFPPETSVTDATVALLNFGISNQFAPLFLVDSTARRSLPSSLLFSAYQDQLYLVDFEAGVRRIGFSPLSIADGFE